MLMSWTVLALPFLRHHLTPYAPAQTTTPASPSGPCLTLPQSRDHLTHLDPQTQATIPMVPIATCHLTLNLLTSMATFFHSRTKARCHIIPNHHLLRLLLQHIN